MSVDVVATAFAGLLTACVGAGAFISNARSKRRQDDLDERTTEAEEKLSVTTRAVEIEREEREGWVELIKQLRQQVKDAMGQYSDASTEVKELRGELRESHRHFDMNAEETRLARERIAVLERDLERARRDRNALGDQIRVLREMVIKLGGDVDEINNRGKRGEKGETGDTGDKGATGDTGDKGATGDTSTEV